MKKNIKLLVMDVDGTLTDGRVYMGNDGEIMKAFHIKDGCGIHDLLIPSEIIPVIITGRASKILEKRCEELGITIYFQNVQDKEKTLQELLVKMKLQYCNVAYIGDDINDSSCMRSIRAGGGLTACPNDAVQEVRTLVNFICIHKGGEGAVREFIEWLLK